MFKPAPAAGFAALVLAFAGLAAAQPADDGQGPNRRIQAQAERLMANDKNNDGKLQADELPARLAERLFPAADADGDGAITRDELIAHLSEARPGGPAGPGVGAPAERPDVRNAPPRGPRQGAPSEARGFEDAMRQAGGAMRVLRRSDFSSGSAEADLGALQAVQEALVTAKATFGEAPVSAQARERFGDDRAGYAAAFRQAVNASLRAALDLEDAVLAGDAAAAARARDALLASQKQAHDLFQED